ncbi:hypothetical protein [Bacillus toyonensis]|uniref:hypothetical protein n=1 Tax=Bacillus toyonensis TaxID=155322 RepID=UPI000BF51CD4|nr:hypothetical protein [Bacillus toyonensis]PGF05294.1 hypothetical protein COM61_02470 [Bacillus toyonensis]
MKAKKLIALTVPVMLLFGCGVVKDTKPKVEETSKAMLKTNLSEKEYPSYMYEQLLKFSFSKDNIIFGLGYAQKGDEKYKELFKTAEMLDETLDRMENVKAPDKYKDVHKLILEGVEDARKGIKPIVEAKGKDANEVSVVITNAFPHLDGMDRPQWKEATYQLIQENKDEFEKVTTKVVEELGNKKTNSQ